MIPITESMSDIVVHACIMFSILLYIDWLRRNVITHAQCMIMLFGVPHGLPCIVGW